MKLRWLFSQLTHLIHTIAPKTHVSGRFGPFRYGTKVDAKLAELVQLTYKFAKQSRC
jgi:ribosomal protein L37AE/L43A